MWVWENLMPNWDDEGEQEEKDIEICATCAEYDALHFRCENPKSHKYKTKMGEDDTCVRWVQ